MKFMLVIHRGQLLNRPGETARVEYFYLNSIKDAENKRDDCITVNDIWYITQVLKTNKQ